MDARGREARQICHHGRKYSREVIHLHERKTLMAMKLSPARSTSMVLGRKLGANEQATPLAHLSIRQPEMLIRVAVRRVHIRCLHKKNPVSTAKLTRRVFAAGHEVPNLPHSRRVK